MELKRCRVTVSDLENVQRTVEVTAGSLYEAVAAALNVIGAHEWAAKLVHDTAIVTVQNAPVEHTVQLRDFKQWLDKSCSTSPAEMMRRKRVKELLGK